MGEAKNKRRRHEDIFKNAKGCVYCGADDTKLQIEHMPPRSMFRMSQRPKGLEFPSCSMCNQGTSKLDVVATFMMRTFPGIQNNGDSQEWDKVMHEIKRIDPALIREMFLPKKDMLSMMLEYGVFDPDLAVLVANGPILSSYMQAFSAKVGFALHYEATGKVVAENERVQVRWFTSLEMMSGDVPSPMDDGIEEIRSLRQGKINTNGHFEYCWGEYSLHPYTLLYYAKFRESFLVAVFIAPCDNLPFAEGELATFCLGDLQKPFVDRITD